MTECADERRAILHEAVTATAQQMATIVLVLGLAREDASTDARAVLDRVEHAARTALAELRLLTRLLDPEVSTDVSAPLPPSPCQVADACAAQLRAAAASCRWDVPAASDSLPETVRTSLSGVMRCVRDVALRTDPAPASVDLDVVLSAGQVAIEARITGAVDTNDAEAVLAPVATRVRISGGELSVECVEPTSGGDRIWELSVWLRC